MAYDRNKPLMVQKDMTVLLDARHPEYDQLREKLGRYADLVKTPEPVHTYRISPLSLWNAAAAGIHYEEIIHFLQDNNKLELPLEVSQKIGMLMKRYGLIRLEAHEDRLRLVIDGGEVLKELEQSELFQPYLQERLGSNTYAIAKRNRGILKQELIRKGFPVLDFAGYHQGEALDVQLKLEETSFQLRDYQQEAVERFMHKGGADGGNGLLVLPCGAGKTLIGIASMARIGKACLILTTNVTSVRQWKEEIISRTNLTDDKVGEYTGENKQVRPVTIATYQILTYRRSKQHDFAHMELFQQREWGLIIYDEVHLLPAPVFRATADIQATRRLGLTATLVREDGREEDVFSLVGPKRYDVSWKELEHEGWIAKVECVEVRVPLASEARNDYIRAGARKQHRIAGENEAKIQAVEKLLVIHAGRPAIIIGQYLEQLEKLAHRFKAPMISGQMPYDDRQHLYEQFKQGLLPVLIVSKVANFAVDLPDASLAIQVSGSFGSRQEEAQRLGRILRPKPEDNRAFFYTVVSADTKEQDFAMKRQLFLLEQGYRYRVNASKEISVHE